MGETAPVPTVTRLQVGAAALVRLWRAAFAAGVVALVGAGVALLSWRSWIERVDSGWQGAASDTLALAVCSTAVATAAALGCFLLVTLARVAEAREPAVEAAKDWYRDDPT